MNEHELFGAIVIIWIVIAVVVFFLLIFVTAPYGRHKRSGWGPRISSKLGWIMMEAPAPLLFLLFFSIGSNPVNAVSIVFLIIWQLHYINRAFVFPLRNRGPSKDMPVVIALFALFFNLVNAYLQGRYLFTISSGFSSDWFLDPRFILGVLLFIIGFTVNNQSDNILLKLRHAGEPGYKIPQGGFYRWISCPNYLGEIIEWCGWALATWSLAGFSFALWTVANLAPRAIAHHRWYRENFKDYPTQRKALIPYVI